MNKIKFDATVLSLISNDYEYMQDQAENDVRKNMRSMLQSPTTPGIIRGFTLESGYNPSDMSLVRITHDVLGTAVNYLGTVIETSTGINDLELLSSVLGIHTYFCISFSIVDASYDKLTQTIVVGEQKAVDLTDYSAEYNRSIETFEIVRYTAGQYAALTDEQLKNIICLGTAYRDNVNPLVASAITTTNRTDLKTFIADGSITVDQIDSSFLLPQINVDNSNTYDDDYVGTPVNLENDLNRLRKEVKDIKGTADWENTASANLNSFDYKMNEVHYNGIFNDRDNFECVITSSGTALLLQSGKSLVEGRISTIEDDAEQVLTLSASDRSTVGVVGTLIDGESLTFVGQPDTQMLVHTLIDPDSLRIFEQIGSAELYKDAAWTINSSTGAVTSIVGGNLAHESVWAFYDWGYPRYDVVEVTSTGTFRILDGVASASPTPPNTDGSLRLHTIYRDPVTTSITNNNIKDSRNYVKKVRELHTTNADTSINKPWVPYKLTYLTSTGYVDLNWDQWTISGSGSSSIATTTSNGAKIQTVIHVDVDSELYINLAKQIDGGTITIDYETVPGSGTLDGSTIIDFSSNLQMLNSMHLIATGLLEGYHLVELTINNSNTTIINSLTFGKSDAFSIIQGAQFNNTAITGSLEVSGTIYNGTYYINTQTAFDNIIENVTGTQYQFIDDVVSVVFNNLSGGYQLPSSGNGYLETNNCISIEMKGGAFFDANAGVGYLKVDTDDCYLRNVWVQGNGSVGATERSYLLNANRVTFNNCKCSNRNSNTAMSGFEGSSTVLHRITSKYINCSAFTLDSSSNELYGFWLCNNLSNPLVYDLDGVDVYGIASGYNISNAFSYDIAGTNFVYAYFSCLQLSNCRALQLDAPECRGFTSCQQISSCTVEDVDATADTAYGFYSCFNVSACYVLTISSSGGDAIGYYSCDEVSGCKAEDVEANNVFGDATGFSSCDQITGCTAKVIDTIHAAGGDATGFLGCNQISGCYCTDIDSVAGIANGFASCNYGAALYTDEATNNGNDFIDTSTGQVTNNVSTPAIWT